MAKKSGSGWYDLAGAVLGISGVIHGFAGISGLVRSEAFLDTSALFGSLTQWAWVWIVLGTAQIIAAAMLLGGGGRMFGIIVTAISAIAVFASHDLFPHDGTLIIVLDVLIIYGLTVHKPNGDGQVFPAPTHELDRTTPPPMR
jgi:hypothetical protein